MQNFSHTIWMGDLENYMDEPFIKRAFESMHEDCISVKVIKNKVTGQPMGYCFVEFPDAEGARNCMLRLNGKLIPGSSPVRRFKLNHASYGKEHLNVQEYSLFVGELSEDVDDLALYTAFKKYPSCRSSKVVLDNGQSRGYGFVRFTDETDQKRAMVEMQNYLHLGRKPIRVSMATPKRAAAAGLADPTLPIDTAPTPAEMAMTDTVTAAIAAAVSGSSEAQAEYYQAAYQAYQTYYTETGHPPPLETGLAAPPSYESVTAADSYVPPPPGPAPSTYLEEPVDPDEDDSECLLQQAITENSQVYRDFEKTRWSFTHPYLASIVDACQST